jgi:hypothetical protein
MGVTYDARALVAADRGERRMWARHRALLTAREVPTVPAPVVARPGVAVAVKPCCPVSWLAARSKPLTTTRPGPSGL